MKDTLALAGIAFVFTFLLAALAAFVKSRDANCPEVTPRMLAADPDFYKGRKIRVATSGMESVNGELRFRAATDQPYRVVCRFHGKLPDPITVTVTGVCQGQTDGAALVTDCR